MIKLLTTIAISFLAGFMVWDGLKIAHRGYENVRSYFGPSDITAYLQSDSGDRLYLTVPKTLLVGEGRVVRGKLKRGPYDGYHPSVAVAVKYPQMELWSTAWESDKGVRIFVEIFPERRSLGDYLGGGLASQDSNLNNLGAEVKSGYYILHLDGLGGDDQSFLCSGTVLPTEVCIGREQIDGPFVFDVTFPRNELDHWPSIRRQVHDSIREWRANSPV